MSALKSNGRPEGEVLITYGVEKGDKGWWAWAADDDGRPRICGGPADRDAALAVAKAEAESLATRYIGDWKVTVEEVEE